MLHLTNILNLISTEVYNAYNRIHELGISHMDINRWNILKAPEREAVGEGTGTNSDSNDRAYQCRIIDFELSTKSNFNTWALDFGNGQYIERMTGNPPKGHSMGQYW